MKKVIWSFTVPLIIIVLVKIEKKEILRRLNQKVQTPEEDGEKASTSCSSEPCPPPPQPIQHPITEERPPTGGDRKKWEAVPPPILSVAEQTLEETCATLAGANSSSIYILELYFSIKM